MANEALDSISEENRQLAIRVLERAREHGVTLGCAESCTGGMIAAALTAVPGSSESFVGGIVSYWVEVKEAVLGVDADIIGEHGVVSVETAMAMASGAREVLSCDYAVATTGIAGPTGAQPGKPVGTVCYGIATPHGCDGFMRCAGDSRDEVRAQAVTTALTALLEALS
mgnify:CR=1 FL=1